MNSNFNFNFTLLQAELGDLTSKAVEVGKTASGIAGDMTWILIAVGLIVATLLILNFLKNLIVNSVTGLIAWAILYFVLKIELQLIPSLIVSAVFGPAGVGAILILKFLGMPI